MPKVNFGTRRTKEPRLPARPRPSRTPGHDIVEVGSVPLRRKIPGEPKMPRALREHGILALPDGVRFTQDFRAPAIPGRVAFTHLLTPNAAENVGRVTDGFSIPQYTEGQVDDDWGMDHTYIKDAQEQENAAHARLAAGQRHRIRREKQALRWQQNIIPALIQPYMAIRIAMMNEHPAGSSTENASTSERRHCRCAHVRRHAVKAAYWDHYRAIHIDVCDCRPAPITLLQRGLFACAPVLPSLAVDLNLMEFVSTASCYMAPNVTGWTLTLEWFWLARGYVIGPRDSLRRRFSNALQWYNVLTAAVSATVDEAIPRMHAPVTGHNRTIPAEPLAQELTAQPVGGNVGSSSADNPAIEICNEPSPSPSPSPSPASGGAPSSRPSDYLRSRCPACFGAGRPCLSMSTADVLVSLDANFSQKCRESQGRDPPLSHPDSRFLSEAEVASMERIVDAARTRSSPKNQKEDVNSFHARTMLPEEILNECERSFLAAQEKVVKASSNFYADTGLMALVCRHDRVLWMTNLTSPGEKQHYALALLQKLFKHLPSDWSVGVLYDIACQLARSMTKHGLLGDFHGRLTFAVSVFHAYGHQWPCQLLYHPRKCRGFGLTDGEGCERVWSAMRRLIPSLRVSGHFRRLFVLDSQMIHYDLDSLQMMGSWITRKHRSCDKHLREAQKDLRLAGTPETVLREEWADQIVVQTTKLTCQSKNTMDKIIEKILELREDIASLRTRAVDLRRAFSQLDHDDSVTRLAARDEIEETEAQVSRLQKKLAYTEKALGVEGQQRLHELKGNGFLRLRVNARALKARIRVKVVDHKFERRKLEHVYRHQVMRDREHAQSKKLITRTRQSVTSLISRYNKTVEDMEILYKRGEAPEGITLPRKMYSKEVFRLDVDDAIWNDQGLGPSDEATPAWLGQENVRKGIAALLECDRVAEEKERLHCEEMAMFSWIQEESRALRIAWEHSALVNEPMACQLRGRINYLHGVCSHWRQAWRKQGDSLHDWAQVMQLLEGTDHVEDPDDRPASELLEVEQDCVSSDDGYSGTEVEPVEDEDDELEELCESAVKDDEGGNYGDEISPDEPSGPECSQSDVIIPATEILLDVTKDSSIVTMPSPEAGRRCGRFRCHGHDITKFVRHDGWTNGRIISVLSEAAQTRLGETAYADYLDPTLLTTVQEYMTASVAKEESKVEARLDSLIRELKWASPPSDEKPWIIPAHVPAHWTCVIIDWTSAIVRFTDSLPRRASAKQDESLVEAQVYSLLEILVQRCGVQLDLKVWRWISEQRETRQTNDFDCGLFVLADIMSILEMGELSSKTQEDMSEFRQVQGCMLRQMPAAAKARIFQEKKVL